MKTRIISGLIMVPLVIVLITRGLPLTIVAFIVSGMGIWELFKGFEKMEIRPNIFIGLGALVVLYVFLFLLPNNPNALTLWIVLVAISCGISLFGVKKGKVEDALATFFGIIYVEFFIYHIIRVADTELPLMVWPIVITAFVTDIAAYFAGSFLGKHKLCPDLSPKKTIEGSIGGILGSVVACIIFGLITKMQIFPSMIVIGLCGSVFAQLGDLTASAIKRKIGIKDYGDIIPGHGGILDRFDSLIFTAPFIYYYIVLVMQG